MTGNPSPAENQKSLGLIGWDQKFLPPFGHEAALDHLVANIGIYINDTRAGIV
jgi:hypothetical protein